MHYYQFNIGDYAKHTRHLTLMEDLAYRRLLDLYYTSEKPLSVDVTKLARLVGMPDYQTEVSQVLDDFFLLTDDGYMQKRVDDEIVKYNAKADSARVNGKKGGRPQKPKITQPVNLANPNVTGSKANQEPLTINQEPLTISKGKTGDGDAKFMNMKELNANAIKYLGWNAVLTPGRAEQLRPLTEVFRDDVVRGFEAASANGKGSVNYVIAVANKKGGSQNQDHRGLL